MNAEVKSSNQRYNRIFSAFVPYIALIALVAFFSFVSGGKLLGEKNINVLINQLFPILLIALGSLFMYAHGTMDLTIGANVGVCMVAGSITVINTGSIALGFALMLGVALLVELINGILPAYLGLPAFLASLVLMIILRGIVTFSVQVDTYKIDSAFGVYDNTVLKAVILLIAIGVIFYMFYYTKFGKYNRAIGGNEVASKLLGIPVARYKLMAYLMVGVVVGIAAFITLCRTRYVSSDTGAGMEFDIMLAMIFGGIPLSGGSRTKFRSAVIGSFIYVLLGNGMILWGLDTGLVALVKGFIFLFMVYLNTKKTLGPLPRDFKI
jgi:Ribose/xylose/arabinose/galactoside ABC-type transport systems, permease components